MAPHLRDSAQFSASLPKAFSVSSARQLRGRFEQVEQSDRSFRGALAAAVLLSLLAAPVALVEITKGWPLDTTLRHFAAAAGCTAARAVTLAPAQAGEPGYWPWLDRDGRGVSCGSPAPSRAAGLAREGAVSRPQQNAPRTPASPLRGAL